MALDFYLNVVPRRGSLMPPLFGIVELVLVAFFLSGLAPSKSGSVRSPICFVYVTSN